LFIIKFLQIYIFVPLNHHMSIYVKLEYTDQRNFLLLHIFFGIIIENVLFLCSFKRDVISRIEDILTSVLSHITAFYMEVCPMFVIFCSVQISFPEQ